MYCIFRILFLLCGIKMASHRWDGCTTNDIMFNYILKRHWIGVLISSSAITYAYQNLLLIHMWRLSLYLSHWLDTPITPRCSNDYNMAHLFHDVIPSFVRTQCYIHFCCKPTTGFPFDPINDNPCTCLKAIRVGLFLHHTKTQLCMFHQNREENRVLGRLSLFHFPHFWDLTIHVC